MFTRKKEKVNEPKVEEYRRVPFAEEEYEDEDEVVEEEPLEQAPPPRPPVERFKKPRAQKPIPQPVPEPESPQMFSENTYKMKLSEELIREFRYGNKLQLEGNKLLQDLIKIIQDN